MLLPTKSNDRVQLRMAGTAAALLVSLQQRKCSPRGRQSRLVPQAVVNFSDRNPFRHRRHSAKQVCHGFAAVNLIQHFVAPALVKMMRNVTEARLPVAPYEGLDSLKLLADGIFAPRKTGKAANRRVSCEACLDRTVVAHSREMIQRTWVGVGQSTAGR